MHKNQTRNLGRHMNRQVRRAAKKQVMKQLKENAAVTAAHEAGHAVAYYLTAKEMGYDVSEAIYGIELPDKENTFVKLNEFGSIECLSVASTHGPMLSREMLPDHLLELDKRILVREAKAKGADIDTWLNARALVAIFGPMAEARATQRPLYDVLNSFECSNDMKGINSDCDDAGLSKDEQKTLTKAAIERGLSLIERPEIFQAIDQLTAAIIKRGSMSGKHACMIIGSAISGCGTGPSKHKFCKLNHSEPEAPFRQHSLTQDDYLLEAG